MTHAWLVPWMVAIAALSACEAGAPIDDAQTIALHRGAEVALIRGVDACVTEIEMMPEVGYGEVLELTLEVQRDGGARVISFRETHPGALPQIATPACRAKIEAAVAAWRYEPFKRFGIAVRQRIVDRALVLPAERRRSPRRPFPQIVDRASLRITLERMPAFYTCSGDRLGSRVEVLGSGEVIVTEIIREPDGRYGHGPQRRITVAPESVDRLAERFRAADFFSLEAEYVTGWTHQSMQAMTVEIGADRAEVVDYLGEFVGMPLVVRDLQVAIDDLAGLPRLKCGPGYMLWASLLRPDSGN